MAQSWRASPAGQTAGFLGKQWEPERVICNPALPGFQIESYSLPQEIPALRLSRRESLLNQVGLHFDEQSRGPAVRDYDYFTQEAFGLLTSGKARAAFDVEREPAALRDRYGRTQWGQCVLLARRLVEAGVRLVHVNWCREGGDTAIDNPMWDTHAQNGDRVKEVLCPQFDVGFTALIEDLEQRGLLSETLVVAVGEFGRTPKINSNGGRDHWGPVFSFALAGAGIKGGQVYGASDKQGAYPIANKVQPPEFTATLFHLLGIGQETTFPDRTGRPLLVCEGEPLHTLLGTEPATAARTTPGGDLARAAAYDPALLIDGNFESLAPLLSVEDRLSFRSWQALPLWEARSPAAFAVQQVREVKTSRSGQQHVRMGFGLEKGTQSAPIPAGARLLRTQKLSSPRAGQYTFSIHARGGGTNAAFFEEFWQKNFTCRLSIFAYADLKQDPREGREFASAIIQPRFVAEPTAADYQRFEVTTYLRSQDGGAMQTSKGVGVAVVVEYTGAADLNPDGNAAFLRIDDVAVDFNPRPRDENVRI